MGLGRTVLYLCNRTALQEQITHQLWEMYLRPVYGEEPSEWVDWLSYGNTILPIAVMTYQSFLGYKKIYEGYAMPDYYYVIFDEIHFFFEDSMFNAMTEHTFSKIMHLYRDST